MGSSSSKISVNALEAYKSLKRISIEKRQNLTDIYLISTKSIPNFINIIKQPNIVEDLNKNNEGNNDNEEIISKAFENYERDKRIKLLSNFVECWRLAEQDIEIENEFIIVDESFITGMKVRMNHLEKMKVSIEFDNKYDKLRNVIIFRSSVKMITFEKKETKLYKFTINDENRSLLDDSDSDEEDNKKTIENEKNNKISKNTIENEKNKINKNTIENKNKNNNIKENVKKNIKIIKKTNYNLKKQKEKTDNILNQNTNKIVIEEKKESTNDNKNKVKNGKTKKKNSKKYMPKNNYVFDYNGHFIKDQKTIKERLQNIPYCFESHHSNVFLVRSRSTKVPWK